MHYITVREAAWKWNISERLVQQYCTDGRLPGAKKFGGAWAIPADAEKPKDARKAPKPSAEGDTASSPEEEEERFLLPLVNSPFPPGSCLAWARGMRDPQQRDIALAEYAYFSGHPEQTVRRTERYLTHPEPVLRLSACILYGYASLPLGKIDQARLALTQVKAILSDLGEDTPPSLRTAAVLVASAATVLLHLPLPPQATALREEVQRMPTGLRLFALYVQAHQAYLQGEYGRGIGIVETAFAMGAHQYPIPAIYLHLAASMSYMGLKQPEPAQAHLLAAWDLARPDDLIEGFGEHHGLLGGLLEAVIKKDWPEDFKRIIAITYQFSDGWRKVHNPVTGHDVADNLTTTEFAAAMLAARGWTNQEIADHMGISPNTVKQHISNTLQKLHIKQRKDLKDRLLR